MALLNYECAINIWNNAEKAGLKTFAKWGRNETFDCSDAFRHAYWMALLTRASNCGASLALAFGYAHECEWPDELLDKQMDLHNNSFGIELAINNPGLTEDELADLICNYLFSGDLQIIVDEDFPSKRIIQSTGCTCL